MTALPLITISLSLLAPVQGQASFTGLGSHAWKVTTRSAEAQRYFNEGLAFLYGFNHDEAVRLFTKAAEADPDCAMAWWGIATACGPNINNTAVDESAEKMATDALARARSLRHNATPMENALIEAASKRFAHPQPKDRMPLNRAYADAMRNVWKAHRNADVGALFAESMMILRPWDLWTREGTPQPGTAEIVKTLREVLTLNAYHPFALHLYIHAVEASPNPGQAMDAADRLRNLNPGLGHMVHMPSHIDVRVGAWQKAITANKKAIAADEAYTQLSPRQGFYSVYMAHNRHMLCFAAMMVGQSKLAMQMVDEMVANIPAEFIQSAAPVVDGFMAMPIEVRVRFGMWDEVLATPEYSEVFPLANAMRRAARAVAYAAKGMPKEARAEQWHFYQAVKLVPDGAFFGNNSASDLLAVATHLMNGEILVAEGNLSGAVAHLRRGAKAEDQLRYDEPPDWIQPVRHTLGAVLLRAKRYPEAEQVYRDDLKRLPNNGWSLFGLAQALDKQGKANEARRVRNEFNTVWASADITIDSSCLCIPSGR